MNAIVGLSITADAVTAVELKGTRRARQLVACAQELLPHGSVRDGVVADESAVSAAIVRTFQRRSFTTNRVCLSLSRSLAFVKYIELPPMTAPELREALHWEAQQHIPFEVDEASVDFQILETEISQGSVSSGTRVVLVAAKKSTIDDLIRIAALGRAVVAIVDVDVLALENAYEASYGCDQGRVVVLLDLSGDRIATNLLCGGRPLFTDASQVRGALPSHAVQCLQRAIDAFTSDASPQPIDRIMLSGNDAQYERVADTLRAHVDVPVEPLNPFEAIDLRGWRGETLPPPGSTAIAVGLALRQRGSR